MASCSPCASSGATRTMQRPAEVQKAYRGVPSRMKNVEVHILPGILHGYMMRGNAKAFDQKTYQFSMARALAILKGLRGEGERQSLRRAV